MYSHYRIVVDKNTNKDMLDMFIKAYDKLSDAKKKSAPSVVTA